MGVVEYHEVFVMGRNGPAFRYRITRFRNNVCKISQVLCWVWIKSGSSAEREGYQPGGKTKRVEPGISRRSRGDVCCVLYLRFVVDKDSTLPSQIFATAPDLFRQAW